MKAWLRWMCLGLVAAGCGSGKPASETASNMAGADTVAYVDPAAELSPLRYVPDVVSLNDRCPVRKGRLNRNVPPTFVNGRAIGFC